MLKWAKKLFAEPPKPDHKPATMVEVLQELWDINPKKEKELPPPNVNTDIYAVETRDKNIPRRPRGRRQRYTKG